MTTFLNRFAKYRSSASPTKLLHVLITEQAETCLDVAAGSQLENKIVLAVATRLAAERFMITKICVEKFVTGIEAHQTSVLIKKFKDKFPAERDTVRCLDRVALMTPENIHVNSFMYEPIVDMSDEHLKRLYSDVRNLR